MAQSAAASRGLSHQLRLPEMMEGCPIDKEIKSYNIYIYVYDIYVIYIYVIYINTHVIYIYICIHVIYIYTYIHMYPL